MVKLILYCKIKKGEKLKYCTCATVLSLYQDKYKIAKFQFYYYFQRWYHNRSNISIGAGIL